MINSAVYSDLSPSDLVKLAYQQKVQHILQNNVDCHDYTKSASILIGQPESFFQPSFSLVATKPEHEVTIKFAEHKNKQQFKDVVYKFLDKAKSEAVTSAANSIVEEMYMNAMIDAPREAKQTESPGSAKPRELEMILCDQWLQISCSDPFGSLVMDKFIGRLNEVYSKGAGEVINLHSSGGGAGIGCAILFENCTHMVIGVKKSVVTKFTCLVPVGMSQRKRTEMKKSIQWFTIA